MTMRAPLEWLMQARSTSSGHLVSWRSAPSPDWSGASFPGPGSPEHIAATPLVGKSVGAPATWSPLSDVALGLVSGLWLPGGFSRTGTPAIDLVTTWTDVSGHGRHLINQAGPADGPADGGGYPMFAPGSFGLSCPASFASDLASGITGGIVVIASYNGALVVGSGIYTNPTIVGGSGATPYLSADDLGLHGGGYDDVQYMEATVAGVVPNTPFVGAMKWDGSGLYAAKDSTWSAYTPYWPGQTTLSALNMGANLYVGMGYGFAYPWLGAIKAVGIYGDGVNLDPTKWHAWAVAQGLV
jgi:hypothetical protein